MSGTLKRWPGGWLTTGALAMPLAVVLALSGLPAAAKKPHEAPVETPQSQAFEAWAGRADVAPADRAGALGKNVSGLFYERATSSEPARLWALRNAPPLLYRLRAEASVFVPDTADGWADGKRLRFPNGSGQPDAEGLTLAAAGDPNVYVSTERDGKGANRFSVLRYDPRESGATLVATREWNLTADLPPVAKTNLGLEGLTWVPDAHLVEAGLVDETTRQRYDPARYPGHGSGLFLVGLEANGQVYAYALDTEGPGFHRIASIDSGLSRVMDLSYDRDTRQLWAWCDDHCGNRSSVLAIERGAGLATSGRFVVKRANAPPAGLPAAMNNEGIAVAPEGACKGGVKPFYWSDDDARDGHALRRGTVACGVLDAR